MKAGLEECDDPKDSTCLSNCTISKTSIAYKIALDKISIASLALQLIAAIVSSIASFSALLTINP